MASNKVRLNFNDYAKDSIDDEIAEASANQEQRQEEAQDKFHVPERFVGKSAEEIAKAYVELEKLNSRQAQELGAVRKTVADYEDLQLQMSRPPEVTEPETPVTVDDLYEDAEGAIRRVAGKETNSRIEALEKELQETKIKGRVSELSKDYPDWQETAQDPEFLNWVAEHPYRQRLAAAADQFDFDAADALFGLYSDSKRSTQGRAEREQQLRDATLESGSASVPEHEDSFSRYNLTEARIAAKRGDPNARKWLKDNATAIALAYEKGHITD